MILINIHNSAFDKGDLRKIQIETLRQVALKEYGKGNWVIIGGDWNMNPPGFDPDKITTGDKTFTVETEKIPNDFLPKGWKWIYDEKRPTNRSVITSYTKGETPTTIIDFFLLSPNIQCLNVETINFAFSFSDHNPVFLEALLSNCH